MSRGQYRDSPLELAPSGAGLPEQLLQAPGGFLWWYVDLVDRDGDGLVVIWSFGLPFLPGYAHAARCGNALLPRQMPSLNVATYRDGQPDFYLLQQWEPHQVRWHRGVLGDRWQFGPSRLVSVADGDQRRVELDLELDVPEMDKNVELQLRATGPGVCRPGECHDPSVRRDQPLPKHDWAPMLCGCRAKATMTVGGARRWFAGRVYHDRNGGRQPLHDLGISRWMWGRVPLPDREFIYYVFDGDDGDEQTLMLTVDDRGRVQRLDEATLHRNERRRNVGGLRWWSSMTVQRRGQPWLQIDHHDVVDSSPFYLRSLPKVTNQRGRTVRGVAEFCEPHRIDLGRFRPLVRMRVDRRGQPNSMWLPLFCGPREGRVKRLVGALIERSGVE